MARLDCPVADLRVEKIDPGGCRLDPWRIVDTAGREVGYTAPYPTDYWGWLPPPCWYPYAFASRKAALAKLRELQAGGPEPAPAGGEEPDAPNAGPDAPNPTATEESR